MGKYASADFHGKTFAATAHRGKPDGLGLVRGQMNGLRRSLVDSISVLVLESAIQVGFDTPVLPIANVYSHLQSAVCEGALLNARARDQALRDLIEQNEVRVGFQINFGRVFRGIWARMAAATKHGEYRHPQTRQMIPKMRAIHVLLRFIGKQRLLGLLS